MLADIGMWIITVRLWKNSQKPLPNLFVFIFENTRSNFQAAFTVYTQGIVLAFCVYGVIGEIFIMPFNNWPIIYLFAGGCYD